MRTHLPLSVSPEPLHAAQQAENFPPFEPQIEATLPQPLRRSCGGAQWKGGYKFVLTPGKARIQS